MKLSRPNLKNLRFDKDYKLIGNLTGVHSRFGCDGYAVDGTDENGNLLFAVGIKFRITFHTGQLVDEVVGYLSEVESVVLEHSAPINDLQMLITFTNDVYKQVKDYLQANLVGFDLSFLEFPEPLKMASALLQGLTQLGLYS